MIRGRSSGVNQLLIPRDGVRAFLRRQPEDAVAFVRPGDETGARCHAPSSRHARYAGPLRAWPRFLADCETSAGLSGRRPSFGRSPERAAPPAASRPGIRALVQPEHVRFVDLGIDRHSDEGLNAEIVPPAAPGPDAPIPDRVARDRCRLARPGTRWRLPRPWADRLPARTRRGSPAGYAPSAAATMQRPDHRDRAATPGRSRRSKAPCRARRSSSARGRSCLEWPG